MPWHESYVSDAERLRGRHENLQPLGIIELSNHRVSVQILVGKLERFRKNVLSKYAR